MMEPNWLTLADCLSAHEKLLRHFGGLAGIRDAGLLESALARPQQLYHYESAGLFQLAATYAHGIVSNHPFLDGNKRAGFVAAALFLAANGKRLVAPETEAVIMTLGLAAGTRSADEYAEWLERGSVDR